MTNQGSAMTIIGHFKVEFDDVLTKLSGLDIVITESISALKIKISKKTISLKLNDTNDGSIFKFLKLLDTKTGWVFKVIILDDKLQSSYVLRFNIKAIKNHKMILGNSDTQKYSINRVPGIGVTGTMTHKISLIFNDYQIEN